MFDDFLINPPKKDSKNECVCCKKPSKDKVCKECQQRYIEQVFPQLEEIKMD